MALVVLLVYTLVYLVWLAFGLMIVSSSSLADPRLQAISLLGAALRAIGLLVLLTNAVCLLCWHWSVAHNISYLGCHRPRYGATIACLSWLIPIAHLIVPYLSLREVVRWSGEPVRQTVKRELLLCWWLWVLCQLITLVAWILALATESAQGWTIAGFFDGIRCLLSFITALLAIRLVREITARQHRRHRSIEAVALFD